MERMKGSRDTNAFSLRLVPTIGLIISSLTYPAQAFNPKYMTSVGINFDDWGFPSFKGAILGIPHTGQTKDAIDMIYEPFFGISDPSKITGTMKNAREQIAEACAMVDDPHGEEKNMPEAHFDGEQFEEGQQRLLTLRANVVDSLKKGQGSVARTNLGRLLHTLQDFYSHSNWIELGNLAPNNQLGRKGGKIYTPDKTVATCKDCVSFSSPEVRVEWERNNQCLQKCKFGDHDYYHAGATIGCVLYFEDIAEDSDPLIPDALLGPQGCKSNQCVDNLIENTHLTSGYYGGQNVTKLNPDKCNHGGAFDSGAKGFEGINKDTRHIMFSPHYYLHDKAAEVSIAATTEFLLDLGEELSDPERRLLFGVGPELGFVIDTTSSMGPIIASVRAAAIQIVKDRMGTVNEPASYILAPFNDPEIPGPALTETNPDKFSTLIMGLKATGGWDCPEYAMDGLYKAVQATSHGGSVFLFTDAAAKDVERSGEVASLAQSKGVKVFPFLFPGPCKTTKGFELVAEKSGGQVLSLNTADAGKMTKLADAVTQANFIDLLKIKALNKLGLLRRASESHVFYVDSGMTQLTFSLSGDTGLEIQRPDGSNVTESDPSVTVVRVTGATLFIISSPVPGLWNAVAAPGNYSLSVFGAGSIHFITFDFVELRGSNGHFGHFPIRDRELVAYEDLPVITTLDGAFKTAHFEFRNRAGALLSAFDLEAGTGEAYAIPSNVFSGTVTVPNSEFYVYVIGEDGAGTPYQRVYPRLFTPILSNSTMGSNTTHTNTTVSVAPLYPNTTTTTTIISKANCTSCSACSHGGACTSLDKNPNYPTSPINLDDYLTETIW